MNIRLLGINSFFFEGFKIEIFRDVVVCGPFVMVLFVGFFHFFKGPLFFSFSNIKTYSSFTIDRLLILCPLGALPIVARNLFGSTALICAAANGYILTLNELLKDERVDLEVVGGVFFFFFLEVFDFFKFILGGDILGSFFCANIWGGVIPGFSFSELGFLSFLKQIQRLSIFLIGVANFGCFFPELVVLN